MRGRKEKMRNNVDIGGRKIRRWVFEGRRRYLRRGFYEVFKVWQKNIIKIKYLKINNSTKKNGNLKLSKYLENPKFINNKKFKKLVT